MNCDLQTCKSSDISGRKKFKTDFPQKNEMVHKIEMNHFLNYVPPRYWLGSRHAEWFSLVQVHGFGRIWLTGPLIEI